MIGDRRETKKHLENGPPPQGVLRTEQEIAGCLKELARKKFTGEVIFRLRFNQGGIRESRVRLEKAL